MKNLLIIAFLATTSFVFGQTEKETEMVNLINQVRTNPKSFIPVVEEYVKTLETPSNAFDNIKIKGAVVTKKTSNKSAAMKPYIDGAKELITFLKTQKPVKALTVSKELYEIAKSQSTYLDSIKTLTHSGPNGATFANRTKNIFGLSGENCGVGQTATEALIMFLIDLGNQTKGHRKNIFLTDYTKVAVGNNGQYWVQDFKN